MVGFFLTGKSMVGVRPFFYALLFLVSSHGSLSAQSTITLYTEDYQPYSFEGEEGRVSGIATAVVRQIMEEAGLQYTVRLMPWPRAFREAGIDNQGFIFSLARSKGREAKFDWIAPLAKPDFYLFAPTNDPRVVTFDAIAKGMFTAVCVNSDSSCAILRNAGFPEDKLFKKGNGGPSETIMTQYKRVDLYLEDLNHFPYRMAVLGMDAKTLKPALRVGGGLTMYLAAGLHVEKNLRDKVREAYGRLIENGQLVAN